MRRRRRRRFEVEGSPESRSSEADSQHKPDVEEEIVPEAPPQMVSRFVALLPVLICFLGNGRNAMTLGLAAVAVGLLVVLFPPKNRVPMVILMLIAAMLLPGLISLIPVPVPFRPAWRDAVVNDLQVALPATLSAQPLITLEQWLWLAVMLLWFCWGVAHWQTSNDRGMVIRQVSMGLSALAVVSLLFHAVHWEPVTWRWGGSRFQDIGPFANRNHFAGLMAMNTVLCMASAYDLMRQRKGRWLLHGLGILPSFAVVVSIGSRAGLILFFCGIISWFLASSVRRRSMQKLAVGGALVLALTATVVLFGQQLLKRFTGESGSVIDGITDENRLKVWGETVNLIMQHPALGIGLGNFAAVFGMTNKLGEGFVRYRHPESDWLWFLAEAGWPATFACLVGVFLLLRWTGPWRQVSRSIHRRERRLRMAALLATLLTIGHGFVDVPNHDLPMAMVLGLLASMAFYEQRLVAARGVQMPGVFRLAGIVAVAAGLAWWGAGFGWLEVMGQSSWQRNLARAKQASAQGDARAAWASIEKAVHLAPLNWEAWFLRADIGLKLGHPHAEAMMDFTRSRFLEPNLADNSMIEAEIWMRYNPSMAIPAWREALAREQTLEMNRYAEILKATEFTPELRSSVRQLATNARLLGAYLATLSPGTEFDDTLRDLLTRFPKLDGMSKGERYALFAHWRNCGHREDMLAALQTHPEWLSDGWRFAAEELGKAGKHKEAFEIARKFIVPKVNLPSEGPASVEQLEREFKFSPSDASRGFRLFVAQREATKLDDALKTLEIMSGQPNAPVDVYFEMAKVYAIKQNFAKAWEMTQSYLQH